MIQLPEKLAENYLRSHLSKGGVLMWKNYYFNRTNYKTSRFLILSDCRNDCFFAIRATKQFRFYTHSSFLRREFIIIPARTEVAFPEHTVIDLNCNFLLRIEDMKKLFGDTIKKMDCISPSMIARIDNKVRNSRILSQNEINWILSSKPLI